MNSSETKVGRREFLQKSALLATATAAVNNSALSYSRIAGANDRVSLGHMGIVDRNSIEWWRSSAMGATSR
jgi:nitrous oxide reductase